ncbi:MAG: carbohydrate binding domain-containing protein, partial [Capsulimonadaceae bacterium]|nr:carbohydrate binding domain-containing protein [Capsulimonadaceae bacterium]
MNLLTRLILAASCLTSILALPAYAYAAPGNLVYNGGFENANIKSPPEGWQMWGDEQWKVSGNYTVDSTVAHSGTNSFRIYHPANTAGYVVTDAKYAIPAQTGQMITVSFWARAKETGRAYLEVNGYGPGPNDNRDPLYWSSLDVSPEWKQFTVTLYDRWDFFAAHSKYLRLALWATRDPAAEATLWVDDVVATSSPSTRSGGLVDETTLAYPPVAHRLRPGDVLDVAIDAARPVRSATRDAGGLSFHRLVGFTGVPYNKNGDYTLPPQLESAIKDLRLPMTRFYGVGDEPFGVEGGIDRVADTVRKLGIPEEHTVIELETQSAKTYLGPDVWAHAVEYSRAKGYKFRYWEIGNETYMANSAFPTPDAYAAHFTSVSKAIRTVDPKAQIGLSIIASNRRWGNYLLGMTAGHYDFVVPHYYFGWHAGPGAVERYSVEDVAAGGNYGTLDLVARTNALLRLYNPGRDVYQYDTEWGMDARLNGDKGADFEPRNANIIGTLHRAVRLIYYAREDLLRGASGWNLFVNSREPGFGVLSPNVPDKRYLLYWLYYYFNRHVGTNVLAMDGTAPYYEPPANNPLGLRSGPLTPVLATMDADHKTMYLVIANGSWDKAVPCAVHLKSFAAGKAEGVVLSQDDE